MFLMVLFLLAIFLFSFMVNNKDLASPSVLFSFSFLFCSIWAWKFAKEWGLTPSLYTLLVICLGTLEFVLVCLVVSLFSKLLNSRNILVQSGFSNIKLFQISQWKINVIILVQIVSILIVILTLKKMTGLGNLSDAIYAYRVAVAFSGGQNKFQMPFVVSILWYLSYAAGFYFSYLFVKEYINSKKINKSFFVVIFLSLVISLLKGDRTKAFVLIVAAATYFYCIYKKNSNWKSNVNLKFVLYGVIGLVFLLSTFKFLAILMGREITGSTLDYLSVYIGAQIKNLDTFIRDNTLPINDPKYETQTFVGIIHIFGKIMNWDVPTYSLNLPFMSANGHDLGNVYTTFYAWLYDFGYKGVFWLVLLMAAINQFLYEHIKFNKSYRLVNYDILIYGFFTSTLMLSFFSDKFYEQVFNIQFVYLVIMWILLNLFICFNSKAKH